MQGTYILVLFAKKSFTKTIGALGDVVFKRGFYCYVGSAMAKRGSATLENRLRRHVRATNEKGIHWHIDYLLTNKYIIVYKIFVIPNPERLECRIAEELREKAKGFVKNFGSSDCACPSHLLYFQKLPILR
ncbi:MAG: GIY-YIG nuclease family protein [Promethearchaeia archaeon]